MPDLKLLALDSEDCEQRVRSSVERALAAALPVAVGARSRGLEREWQWIQGAA